MPPPDVDYEGDTPTGDLKDLGECGDAHTRRAHAKPLHGTTVQIRDADWLAFTSTGVVYEVPAHL